MEGDAFKLPMSTIALFHSPRENETVAHNLDFDLVCVGPTQDEAMKRLRLAVKAYVEYGLENGLEAHIRRPAPKEYWDMVATAKISGNTETIRILDRRIFTTPFIAPFTAPHELRDAAIQTV